jgi:2-isopropylmalate synthase
MHARAVPEEVHAALRAGADWVGIWASINSIALKAKFIGRSEDHVLAKVQRAIAEAKQLGLKVRFTIEDASRTEWEQLAVLAGLALRAGADRISLADTVGVLEPEATKRLFGRALDEWGCELAGHFHDDLGLAQANALAAIDVGAAVVDVSICGIGERAGITDLLLLATALRRLRDEQRFCLPMIPELVEAITLTTGHQPDDLRPVIGSNAFTHTSRYHVQAMQRMSVAYEPFPPEWVGRERELIAERPALGVARLSDGLAAEPASQRRSASSI